MPEFLQCCKQHGSRRPFSNLMIFGDDKMDITVNASPAMAVES
jgi:hypothetical protein